jgi:hypothetical protein
MKTKSYCWQLVAFILLLFGCTDPGSDVSKIAGSPGGAYSLMDGGGIRGEASGSGGNGGDSTQYQPGVITAGEWNDNLHWNFWTDLLSKQEYKDHLTEWGINPKLRLPFLIKDSNNRSLIDAVVEIKNAEGKTLWKCRTDNFGKAVAWPSMFSNDGAPDELIISYDGNSYNYKNFSFKADGNTLTVPVSRDQLIDADIALVVDATGSMGDELEYFKVELNDVLEKASKNNCSNWRIGSVFYRDEGDEYVTRTSPFTTHASSIINFVKNQKAENGGDWPEAVHKALEESVNNLNWSSRARARLLFLVLDAPPHKEQAVMASLVSQIKVAAEKGIKIIPVVASGIDKETEFLMRSWSLATNGTYVFITDHSGIGGDHLEPTVGDYKVEKLNDLLVRLIYLYTSCTNE